MTSKRSKSSYTRFYAKVVEVYLLRAASPKARSRRPFFPALAVQHCQLPVVETPEFQTPRTLSKRSWTFLFLSATLEKAASPIGRYKKNNQSSVISCTNKPSLTGHWDGCFFLRFRCQPSKEEHCWQDGSPLTLVSLVSLVPQKPMASNPPSITEQLAW